MNTPTNQHSCGRYSYVIFTGKLPKQVMTPLDRKVDNNQILHSMCI